MQKRILIVEDDEEIRKDLVLTLNFSNYTTYEAIDGYGGFEMAKKYLPDLIMSDIMMPNLDGYGFLRKLQNNADTATIPFLFLSAKSDIREGMNLGADDYITKPYDIDELLEAVATRLRKHEASETKFSRKFEELRSNISRYLPHEIRTPLGIILGYSDFLKQNFDSTNVDDAKEILDNINEAGNRLSRLFENYLYYAKLQTMTANENEITAMKNKRLASVDLIIEDIVNYISANAGRKKDLSMKLESATINLSEEFLRKIIEEILDNSIKFSKTNTSLEITSYKNNNIYYIMFVDYGRGMTEGQINNVGAYIQFERHIYEQQGSGLGLAIVKKIVEMHDGTFSIESEPDKFTKIMISIPCD